MSNEYILPTNMRSKNINTSKHIVEKHDTSHQLMRIPPRNKTNLSQTSPNNDNHITNIDNKIKTHENNNKPQISSKINR